MKLKLPSLHIPHTHRKERTVSVASTQWTWFGILILGAAVFTLGGVHAMYSFMHIDVVSAIPTELRAPVRWQSEKVDAVLLRYGEREEYFTSTRESLSGTPRIVPPPPVATSTEVVIPVATTPEQVATTTLPAVE